MKNLLIRSISGLIFVSIVVSCLLLRIEFLLGLFSILILIGLFEFQQLFSSNIQFSIHPLFFIIIGLSSFFLLISPTYFELSELIVYGIIPLVFIVFMNEFRKNNRSPVLSVSVILFGVFYIVVPLYLGFDIHIEDKNDFPKLLGLFILVWTNDTFAYLCGNLFGRNKLFERISPMKTIEGSLGGIAFSVFVGYLIGTIIEPDHTFFWLISSVLIALFAILGDLFESLIKRKANVKDTGNIMPGHGGVLDRFDAVFFSIPIFYFWNVIYFAFI